MKKLKKLAKNTIIEAIDFSRESSHMKTILRKNYTINSNGILYRSKQYYGKRSNRIKVYYIDNNFNLNWAGYWDNNEKSYIEMIDYIEKN